MERIFEFLHTKQISDLTIDALNLDSTIIKVHPDGYAAEKNGEQSIGKSRGGYHDAPQGRKPLESQGTVDTNISLLIDRAYAGDNTCDLALKLGYGLCVPQKSNRKEPWGYDHDLYKLRNEVEHLFRRLKAYRKIFTRYDKLDVVFLSFVFVALIVEALR